MADPAPTPRAQDWPAQAADRIESVVGTIRERTVRPLTVVVRGVVYGLLAGVLGVAIVVLLAIALVRLVASYLPNFPGVPDDVGIWATHLVVGTFFTLAGLFLWRMRRRKKKG